MKHKIAIGVLIGLLILFAGVVFWGKLFVEQEKLANTNFPLDVNK